MRPRWWTSRSGSSPAPTRCSTPDRPTRRPVYTAAGGRGARLPRPRFSHLPPPATRGAPAARRRRLAGGRGGVTPRDVGCVGDERAAARPGHDATTVSGRRAATHPRRPLDDGLQRAPPRALRSRLGGGRPARALVALLKEDVVVSMPPDRASGFRGRDAFASFVAATILAEGAPGRIRLLPVAANGQPAFALYQQDHASGRASRAWRSWCSHSTATASPRSPGFMDPSVLPPLRRRTGPPRLREADRETDHRLVPTFHSVSHSEAQASPLGHPGEAIIPFPV